MPQLLRIPARAAAGLLLVAAAAGAAACRESGQTAAAADAEALAVRTAQAVEREWSDGIEAGGVIHARTTAVLASRILAPVRAVRVVPGDRVRAGQVLVELDGRDLAAGAGQARAGVESAAGAVRVATAERAAAEAALALARATHARITTLHARGSATAQERDEAVSRLDAAAARAESAAAAVTAAEASLASAREGSGAAAVTASFAMVTAPFDGIVTEKLVEPGNLVTPGTPLLRVEDVRSFRLEVQMDASRAADVQVGDTAHVQSGGASVEGRVTEVARAVDAGARTFLVKVELPEDQPFRSGTFGRARFQGRTRRTLQVPEEALVRQGQVSSVYVVADGRARLRLVRAGDTRNGQVEIAAGLSPDETVVLDPRPALTDGRLVKGGGDRP